MVIKKFQDFSTSGRIYEEKGQPKQNQPSVTGINNKDNIDIPKQDTGDESAGMYNIFLTQARTVISSMGSNVARINPDKGNTVDNRLVAITGNLKPTYDSHRAMWAEIIKLSDFLGGDYQNVSKGELSSLNALDPEGKVTSLYQKNLAELDKRKTTKDITDTQYEEQAKELRLEAGKQIDSTKSLYYMKIGQALDYWMQASRVYKQGALVCLQNMESEAEENTTGKKYLEIITQSAKNILGTK
jgi:hypothetical protein